MPYKVEAKCPCCKKEAVGKKQIDELFGWRTMANGEEIPQSYCYVCRSAGCGKNKQLCQGKH